MQPLAQVGCPNDPASYAPFKGKDYSPTADRRGLRFIQENQDRPFFSTFPSTILMWPAGPDEKLKPLPWNDGGDAVTGIDGDIRPQILGRT